MFIKLSQHKKYTKINQTELETNLEPLQTCRSVVKNQPNKFRNRYIEQDKNSQTLHVSSAREKTNKL